MIIVESWKMDSRALRVSTFEAEFTVPSKNIQCWSLDKKVEGQSGCIVRALVMGEEVEYHFDTAGQAKLFKLDLDVRAG